jgi:hypothetical protein
VGSSIGIKEEKKKKGQMATKSKAAYKLEHTFFIFLFSSSTSAGLLFSLNKHKNDCHSIFFMD